MTPELRPLTVRIYVAVTIAAWVASALVRSLSPLLWILGTATTGLLAWGAWRRWRPLWVLVMAAAIADVLIVSGHLLSGEPATGTLLFRLALDVTSLALLGAPSSRQWVWRDRRPDAEAGAPQKGSRPFSFALLVVLAAVAMLVLTVCGAFVAAGQYPDEPTPIPATIPP